MKTDIWCIYRVQGRKLGEDQKRFLSEIRAALACMHTKLRQNEFWSNYCARELVGPPPPLDPGTMYPEPPTRRP